MSDHESDPSSRPAVGPRRLTSVLDRLRSFVARFANRRGALTLGALFACTLWAFKKRGAWVLGDLVRPTNGCCPELPDGRLPPFAPTEALETIERLPNRLVYAISEVTLDFWFPLLYVTLFGAILVGLTSKALRPVALVLLLPVVMATCDVIENLAYAAIAVSVAGAGAALVGTIATWFKWLGFGATLIAIALLGRHLWPRWLGHLMAIRVPILALLTYLALWWFGYNDRLPTVSNMMNTKGPIGLGAAAFMTMMSLAIITFAATLAWRHAPRRFGLDEIALPRWILDRPVWSVLPFLSLGVPLLFRLYQGAEGICKGTCGVLVITAGAGAAIGLLGLLRWAQHRGVLKEAGQLLVPVFTLFDPGYTRIEKDCRVMRDGHPLAVGVVLMLIPLFALGYVFLDPSGTPIEIPTIAYVLFLIALLAQTLTGVTFYVDYFRIPTVIALVVITATISMLFPRAHYFVMTSREDVSPPRAEVAAGARLKPPTAASDGRSLLTVVTATGGGIQAAAWTAQVLTGLQEALGPRFTDSVQLISTTSGGSVGAFFFLESFVHDDCGSRQAPCFARPAADRLPAIREAAMASSLDATAWGLVFPDFLRALFPPLVPKLQDRAWAMELAWLQNLACYRKNLNQATCTEKPPTLAESTHLADWRRGARDGSLPAVVFNATTVEGGRHVLLSSVALDKESNLQVSLEDWRVANGSPEGSLDVAAVAAARLSSTFPFVTPAARALTDNGERVHPWQVVDGGFFDNFGTVAAVQWLDQVMTSLGEPAPSVLFIQIDAFAPSPRAGACAESHWTDPVLGPAKAILNVRGSTQRVRVEVEVEQLRDRFCDPVRLRSAVGAEQLENGCRDAFRVVTFRPPAPVPKPERCAGNGGDDSGRREPPLSWELSERDKRWICEDWQHSSNQDEVTKLRQDFFPDAVNSPLPPCRKGS